jgi:hypothetical protein
MLSLGRRGRQPSEVGCDFVGKTRQLRRAQATSTIDPAALMTVLPTRGRIEIVEGSVDAVGGGSLLFMLSASFAPLVGCG